MAFELAYLSYDDNDQELKDRSKQILNDFFSPADYFFQPDEGDLLFIASGGSEQNAVHLTEGHQNIILLCHRESNSFAAAIEISAYLRAQQRRVTIVDVFNPNAFQELTESVKVNHALDSLARQKAALIGKVSEWLIVSDVESSLVKQKLGIELIKLPWALLDDYRIKEPSEEFLLCFPETEPEKLHETAKVYSLLNEVIEEKKISAISVECFSLVTRDKVTVCLPLAVLNMKKLVAACEGDICAMLGKMMIRAITGEIPWQANVAEIREDSILFAHCTAPLHMLKSFDITTHFETNSGTAIRGKFEKQKAGAFRIDNKLEKYMLLHGDLENTPDYDFACRTQVEFTTTKEQTKLLKEKSLGNHHLLFPARHIKLLERMMHALSIKRVL